MGGVLVSEQQNDKMIQCGPNLLHATTIRQIVSPVNIVRDKPTVISYAQAACFGWLIFGSGPALIFLRDDLHLSRGVASAHTLGMSIGGIIAGLSAPPLIRKFGRGELLRWGSIFLAVGLCLFCLGQSVPVTLLGVTISFLGGVTIVQSTAAFLSHHHKSLAPAAISELHGVAAAIGLLSPVVIGLCITFNLGWRSGLAIAVLALMVIELYRGRDVTEYGSMFKQDLAHTQHDVTGPLPRAFWWACLAMVCTSGVEYAVLLWSSDYLRTNGGFAKGASAVALGCVVGAMAIGRLMGATLTKRFSAEKLYVSSLALALIGFLGFWFSSSQYGLIIFLTVTGFGLSLHFPFGIERAIHVSSGRADRATTRVAIATALSSGVAPFSIGLLADNIGVRVALLVVPALLIVALFVVLRHPALRKPKGIKDDLNNKKLPT